MKRLLIIALLLVLPYNAFSATHWVDDNGAADWGDCQGVSPLSGASACSVTTANAGATASDLVYLRAGTYTTQLNPSNSGTSGNEITWMPYDNEVVTIAVDDDTCIYLTQDFHIIDGFVVYPTGLSAGFTYIVNIRGDNNTIQNLTIAGSTPEADHTAGINVNGIVLQGGDDNYIYNNEVSGLSGQGITTDDLGGSAAYRNVIDSNYSHDNYGNGFATHSELSVYQGLVVKNNICNGSLASDGIQTNGNYGAGNTTNRGVIIKDNVCAYNAEGGIDIKGGKYIVIEGNIVYGNRGDSNGSYDGNDTAGGVAIARGSGQGAEDIIVRGNIIYDNLGGPYGFTSSFFYNNTVLGNNRNYNGPNQSGDDTVFVGYYGPSHSPDSVKNNIFAGHNTGEFHMKESDEAWAIPKEVDYNLYYNSGSANFNHLDPQDDKTFAEQKTFWATDPGGVDVIGDDANSIEGDPLLTSTGTNCKPVGLHTAFDFSPTASSTNVVDQGGPLTYVDGNHTTDYSITVDNPGFFTNGYGSGVADTVRIGSDIVTVVTVNTGEIIVDTPISPSDNDPIYWCPDGICYSGAAPDIGAVEYTGEETEVVLSELQPTTQQSCDSDPMSVAISCLSNVNAYCRYSADPGDTQYSDMSDQFVSGENTTNHTTDIDQACGGSTLYYIICTDGSYYSSRAEITVDVASSGGETKPPLKIISDSNGINIISDKSGITIVTR